MPFFISFCRSKSFLAFLLGAGVSGALAASALAGDKIEFSPTADSLALPKVDRPDSEPTDTSLFSLRSSAPEATMIYPIMPSPGVAPSRRKVDPNSRNANSGLGSGQDKFGQNGSVENSRWGDTSATDYSLKPANNSNYLDGVKAWGPTQNPDDRGRATDKMDPRYGQPDARQGSLGLAQTRDGQSELGLGLPGNRPWTSRKDDASSSAAKSSLDDALKQSGKSLLGSNPSLFKSPFSDPRDASAWGSSPLMPSDQSLYSPRNPTDSGYNAYKDSSGRALTGRSYPRLDAGNTGGYSAPSAWGTLPGYGSQTPDPAPAYRKAPPPPATGVPPPQQGGAYLSKPKQPGSVFN